MAQDSHAGGSLPIAPIMALLLFAGGMLVQHQPLQSERPPSDAALRSTPYYGQSVEARLWQDPLEAVQLASLHRAKANQGDDILVGADCKDFGEDCHQADWLAKSIKAAQGKTLVLAAMIFGGPYAEDAEERRRTRYAVLAALMANNYEPVNSRGIGYVRFAPTLKLPEVLPFERYQARHDDALGQRTDFDNIIVLWLTEEAFSDSRGAAADECAAAPDEAGEGPRQTLSCLFRLVLAGSSPTVRVLGPGSTQTALALWPSLQRRDGADDSAQAEPPERLRLADHDVDFFAPKFTLTRDSDAKQTPVRIGPMRFSPDDQTLATALHAELQARGLSLGGTVPCSVADDVALVIEADTHYGRNLEKIFTQEMRCDPGSTGDHSPANSSNVHPYRYFRGLDGNVAQAAEDGKKGAPAEGLPAKKDATAPQERAQGQSQFDYLLRMASSAEREEHWRKKPIRAVFILGSDVYDKLAALHAMRERLPGAIFATTDLDASFLQAEYLSWSRNLIVASGYGFRVPGKYALQKGAPPFRDTYQTATFVAASRAIAGANVELVNTCIDRVTAEALSQPRLFEIGDGTLVRLQTVSMPTSGDAANAVRSQCARLAEGEGATNPSPPRQVSPLESFLSYLADAKPYGYALFAAGLLFCFAWSLSWCVRRIVAEKRWLLALAVASLGGYFLLVWILADSPGQEPFRWLAGVSAWPSEVIRVATIALVVMLFKRGCDRLRNGDRRMHEDFFPGLPPQGSGGAEAPAGWLARSEQYLRRMLAGCRSIATPSGRALVFPRLFGNADDAAVDVKALWRDYLRWISPASHGVRVVLATIFYVLLLALAADFDPAVSPVRGEASRAVDHATEWTAIVSVVFLLVATLDRVATATLFLRRLYGSGELPLRSNWDAGILSKFCGAECDAARDYVDLRLSARMTAAVGEIVLYPFAMIVLLFAARSHLFDNWTMPWNLFSLFVLGLGLVTLSAILLRNTAERIRAHAVEGLTEIALGLRAGAAPGAAPGTGSAKDRIARAAARGQGCSKEQIDAMRSVAENIREGAFAPFGEQPIVRALMLPFGGAGVVGFLQYLLLA